MTEFVRLVYDSFFQFDVSYPLKLSYLKTDSLLIFNLTFKFSPDPVKITIGFQFSRLFHLHGLLDLLLNYNYSSHNRAQMKRFRFTAMNAKNGTLKKLRKRCTFFIHFK